MLKASLGRTAAPVLSAALAGYLRGHQDIRPKTAQEWRTVTDRFIAQHGDLALSQIQKEHVRRFRDGLVDQGKAAATVKKHITALSAVLAWAVDEEHIPANPCAGIKVRGGLKTTRLPFDAGNLAAIFSSSVFTQQERPKGCGGGAGFWLPYLGLCTGARLEELAQLAVQDVRQEEDVFFLDITDHGEGQKLKTAASQRRVPLHAMLLQLGFSEYHASLPRDGYLFPELTVGPYGRRSHYWSRWWGRYQRQTVGITDPRKVFHSFRHGFKDACRNAGIDEAVHDALTGHASARVGRRYGRGFSLPFLAQEVAKITFEVCPRGDSGTAGLTKSLPMGCAAGNIFS